MTFWIHIKNSQYHFLNNLQIFSGPGENDNCERLCKTEIWDREAQRGLKDKNQERGPRI